MGSRKRGEVSKAPTSAPSAGLVSNVRSPDELEADSLHEETARAIRRELAFVASRNVHPWKLGALTKTLEAHRN